MESTLQLFYIPVSNEKVAKEMASTLLKENLIACANIFQPHTAIYRWEGKIESEQETLMILKTLKSQSEALESRLNELHPYDCPALISINPDKVNKAFLDWASAQINQS